MFGTPITLVEILGFKVRLGFSWIFLALFITWSLAKGYFPSHYLGLDVTTYWWMGIIGALGFFCSLLVHELAHSYVARRLGIPVGHITLFIFGGVAQMEKDPPSPKTEFQMAIAGPIASFALGAACYLMFIAGYQANLPLPALGVFGYMAFINSLLGGLNLMPAFPLDGGRALRAGLWHWKSDLRRATRPVCLAGTLFGLILAMGGIFHVMTGDFIVGAWWFILGVFLRETSRTSYSQLVTRTTLAGTTVGRFMTPSPVTVSPELSIEDLAEQHLYRSFHDMYPVTDQGRLIGCVSAKHVTAIPRDEWTRLTVRDVALPGSKDNTIDIGTQALAALSIMNRTGNSRLLVTEGGRLVGIVTLKDLMKFLALKLNVEEVR